VLAESAENAEEVIVLAAAFCAFRVFCEKSCEAVDNQLLDYQGAAIRQAACPAAFSAFSTRNPLYLNLHPELPIYSK
jgi:hypothetical protein